MKKLAFVILLALVLVFTLAACNQPKTTYAKPRWKNESHYFTISKTILDGSETIFDDTSYKHELLSSYEPALNNDMDEIVPEDVAGTYEMHIVVNDTAKTCTFTTSQVLYVAYPKTLLQGFSIWDTPDANGNTLADKKVEQDEDPFSLGEEYTTLKSTTDTTVVFHNDASQRPISSKNEVHGFYIGKKAQTISEYYLETEYEWNNKNKVTIKVNGEEQSSKGTFTETSRLIDANQLLLYVRSLDKASDNFLDSPAVTIYMPKVDELVTASFVFTYAAKTTLTVDGEEYCVTLNSVAVIAKSTALLVQQNIPETVNDDNRNLDVIPNSGSSGSTDRYTTVRFHSGIFSYHLTDITSIANGAQILDAVTAKPSASE